MEKKIFNGRKLIFLFIIMVLLCFTFNARVEARTLMYMKCSDVILTDFEDTNNSSTDLVDVYFLIINSQPVAIIHSNEGYGWRTTHFYSTMYWYPNANEMYKTGKSGGSNETDIKSIIQNGYCPLYVQAAPKDSKGRDHIFALSWLPNNLLPSTLKECTLDFGGKINKLGTETGYLDGYQMVYYRTNNYTRVLEVLSSDGGYGAVFFINPNLGTWLGGGLDPTVWEENPPEIETAVFEGKYSTFFANLDPDGVTSFDFPVIFDDATPAMAEKFYNALYTEIDQLYNLNESEEGIMDFLLPKVYYETNYKKSSNYFDLVDNYAKGYETYAGTRTEIEDNNLLLDAAKFHVKGNYDSAYSSGGQDMEFELTGTDVIRNSRQAIKHGDSGYFPQLDSWLDLNADGIRTISGQRANFMNNNNDLIEECSNIVAALDNDQNYYLNDNTVRELAIGLRENIDEDRDYTLFNVLKVGEVGSGFTRYDKNCKIDPADSTMEDVEMKISAADHLSCSLFGVLYEDLNKDGNGKYVIGGRYIPSVFLESVTEQLQNLISGDENATAAVNWVDEKKEYLLSFAKVASYINRNYSEFVDDDFSDVVRAYIKKLREKYEIELVYDCDSLFGEDLKNKIGEYLKIVKIVVPIILIGFGILDFAKALFAGDDEKMKKAQKQFLLRVAIAILFFFVPIIVKFLLSVANVVWGFISPNSCV